MKITAATLVTIGAISIAFGGFGVVLGILCLTASIVVAGLGTVMVFDS